jgi:hypothetical protein
MTMKIRALAYLSALLLSAGCSESSTPTQPSTQSPSNAVRGDVAPSTLYQVNLPSVPSGALVQQSMPASPKVPIRVPDGPPLSTHKEVLFKVQPGSSAQTLQVPVDASTDAWLYLAPHSNDAATIDSMLRGVQVFAPDGTQVNVRAPKPGVEGVEPRPMASMDLSAYGPGMYKVVLSGATAAAGISVSAMLNRTALTMDLQPTHSLFFPTDAAGIDIKLVENGVPIVGAKVTAELILPGTKWTGPAISVVDLGGGRYRAQVSPLLTTAHPSDIYNVLVRAEGTSPSGQPFHRFGSTGTQFVVPSAKIVDVGAIRTLKDASGAITHFETDINVQSVSGDRYEVTGVLVALHPDGTERPVGVAQSADTLGAETKTITLRFDAGYAHLTTMEGPFSLRQVTLFSTGTNALYHRIGGGYGRAIPVRRADLLPPSSLSPAAEMLVFRGMMQP